MSTASVYLQKKTAWHTTWALVLGLHVLLGVVLHQAMQHSSAGKPKTVVTAQLLQTLLPPPVVPPPPLPTPAPPPPAQQTPKPQAVPVPTLAPLLAPAPSSVAAPDVAPTSPATANITVSHAAQPTLPAPPPSAPTVKTRTVPDSRPTGQCEEPKYPRISFRMREEGVVQLRLLIGVTGKVERSEIVKSSGYARLDDAARAALSLCTYKPGTADGQPEASWTTLNYRWQIKDE